MVASFTGADAVRPEGEEEVPLHSSFWPPFQVLVLRLAFIFLLPRKKEMVLRPLYSTPPTVVNFTTATATTPSNKYTVGFLDV